MVEISRNFHDFFHPFAKKLLPDGVLTHLYFDKGGASPTWEVKRLVWSLSMRRKQTLDMELHHEAISGTAVISA